MFEFEYFIFYFDRTEETAAILSASDNHSEITLLYQTKTSVNETFQEENDRNQISKIEENERYSFLFNFIHFLKSHLLK